MMECGSDLVLIYLLICLFSNLTLVKIYIHLNPTIAILDGFACIAPFSKIDLIDLNSSL